MSRVVMKYPLKKPSSGFAIQEPGIVRHVAYQHGDLTLWVEVDSDDKRGARHRRFEVVATGQRFDPGSLQTVYHGTAIADGLVWHVYELVQP